MSTASVSIRTTGAALGLAAFVVSILSGLAADASTDDILTRSVLFLFAGHLLGVMIGLAADAAIADRLRQLRAEAKGQPSVASANGSGAAASSAAKDGRE